MLQHLNRGQQQAADGFFEFLMGDQKELVISGPGGVGKTFLMGHLIDEILPKYQEICQVMGIPPIYRDVMMTATTNKAAEVLGKATRRPTKTIHSYLNLRVFGDHDTGKTRISKNERTWRVHQNTVVFVDEASMIDSQLLKYLHEGTCRCKIVYVGDHCQLAPVTETLSPVYKKNLPFFELTEPMRNADQPALMAVCDQLRETVKTKQFKPIQIVPGVIDLLTDEQMLQEIETHFIDPEHEHRILAYRNKRVMEYNDHIRELRQLPPQYTQGEILVSNSALITANGKLSVEDEVEILQINDQATKISIVPDIDLEVRYARLQSPHATIDGVPVPVDKKYHEDLIAYFKGEKMWREYFYLKESFPDLRPRDAATVHKAQGSTYDTVFIDLSDLSTCRNPDMAARLLYVAFSRAKRRIFLHGHLASKFGGLIT